MVIATVFLSIIGMSAGLVLGARAKQEQRDARAEQQRRETPVAQPSADYDGRPLCRPETQQMARRQGVAGPLRIELLLRTATSAVWICEDEGGGLYYHGNRGGERARWVEGETALFLPGVRRDGDGFAVTAPDGTTFSITAQRLFILHKDGREEVQQASG